MQKKLNVKIWKNGSESEVLLRLVGNVNEGKGDVSVRDLEGYIATRKAMFPSVYEGLAISPDTEPNTYNISEDGGKTFTMQIEFVEIHELEPVPTITQTELA